MTRILIPDAGGYSSKLKALYIQSLFEQFNIKVEFLPLDDNPKLNVQQMYKDLGLAVRKEVDGFDVVLPVSTAFRCVQHGYMPKTPAKILSLFEHKSNLRSLAKGFEIPYMTGREFNQILGDGSIVKPDNGSGSKSIRELSLATHGVIEDHDVIQAKSDDDREYVVDMFTDTDDTGKPRVWVAMRQSLERDQGRDTKVRLFSSTSDLPEAKAVASACMNISQHIRSLVNDPMWFNVQLRWWNNEIRVMEIDSRMSGSAQASPAFGRRVIRYLGIHADKLATPQEWLDFSTHARKYAYTKLGLAMEINGEELCFQN